MSGRARSSVRPRIGVLFSHGTTLRKWGENGLLDREIAYLRRLHEAVGDVHLITYDGRGADTEALRRAVAPLYLHEKRARMDYRLYGILAPILERDVFRGFDILRTTQLGGAWMGSLAKLLWGTPLVVRCGYVRSRNYTRGGMPGWRVALARFLEALVVRSADRVLAATEADIGYLMRISGGARERFVLMPNAIDLAMFAPAPVRGAWSGRVLFVGRLHPEKNVAALIDAVQSLDDLHLTIVGDGPLRAELEGRARPDRVTFAGVLPNNLIPEMLRSCDAFVLPSHFEGNPKSLLEAMAAGCAVVGARSAGIETLIQDRQNGVLCGTDAASIARTLAQLRSDGELRERCRRGAREFAVAHCDVEVLAAREAQLLSDVASRGDRRRRESS